MIFYAGLIVLNIGEHSDQACSISENTRWLTPLGYSTSNERIPPKGVQYCSRAFQMFPKCCVENFALHENDV